MSTYTITHDRDGCISCGACASACSANWEIDEDGKANAKKTEISEEEFECNNKAAAGCPVNVIHIKNKETGEEVV